jgi:tetratricopeptide (TPR) repeat protein
MQWDLGESEEAAQAAQEAVELFMKLAADEPQAFRKHHASASVNLAIMLHQLGHHQEAVEAARRAVDAYKKLARSNPTRFRPELATALCNITPILETAGQPREALRHARWAVRIWRSRSSLWPEERHSFATLLNDLSQLLDAAGKHKKALAAAEEALDHCNALAETLPAAIQPTRAMVLNTLANSRAANGEHKEAVRAAEEALSLYEGLLTERNRKAVQPKRAAVRFNLSLRYREVGDLQQAAQMALAATRDYRELAIHDETFVARFDTAAVRLHELLGEMVQDPTHHEEALRLSQETVELFRSSESLRPQLAKSLVALGSRLGELSRHDEGLEATREGVDLYRELARDDPEEFLLPLAGSLSNLGHRLRWLRRSGEALAHLQEAVDLYRQLDSERPDSIRPQLGPCLCNLSLAFRDLGRLREALPLAEESMRFLTPLFVQNPEFFGEWMEEIEQQYRKTAEAAGSPPDPELLDPVRQALENRRPRGDRHRVGARSR